MKGEISEFDKELLLEAKTIVQKVYDYNYEEPSRMCNKLQKIMNEIEEVLNTYNECYRLTGR